MNDDYDPETIDEVMSGYTQWLIEHPNLEKHPAYERVELRLEELKKIKKTS